MRDHRDDNDGPLWVDGDMMFRVSGTGAEPDRLVKVRHPYAVVGRADDVDIAIDDRAVSARHAYLHLDRRGVYAVDLVTRTGTRINGTPRMVGWLRPGDWVEVAGRRVELLRVRIHGAVVDPPPCDADMLADTGHDALAVVTLEPHKSNDSPWVLGSELVFLGWSASCGIQVKDTSVARTHCALVRSGPGAYLVDLCGRQTWVEDLPVRGAAVLRDGDLLTIGTTQFGVRIEPPSRGRDAEAVPRREAGTFLARVDAAPTGQALAPLEQAGFPINPDMIPAEARGALLAWVMGTIQGGQGEVIRRQGEFQLAMTQVLRQIQQDNATLLNAHLSRIESIDHELAALRAEIERRHAAPPARVPPNVAPLRINRPAATAPEPGTPASQAPTNWLLHRVSQLEDENRSAWKDLLGRLPQGKKVT